MTDTVVVSPPAGGSYSGKRLGLPLARLSKSEGVYVDCEYSLPSTVYRSRTGGG